VQKLSFHSSRSPRIYSRSRPNRFIKAKTIHLKWHEWRSKRSSGRSYQPHCACYRDFYEDLSPNEREEEDSRVQDFIEFLDKLAKGEGRDDARAAHNYADYAAVFPVPDWYTHEVKMRRMDN
jgi:hypothetical protein